MPTARAEKIRNEGAEKLNAQRANMTFQDITSHVQELKIGMQADTEKVRSSNRRKCKDILDKALAVDLESEMKMKRRDRKRGMAMMVFFAVLSGLELDLLGFIGSFPVYWNLKTVQCPHYGIAAEDFNVSAHMELHELSEGQVQEQMEQCTVGILRILLICMPIAYAFTVLAYMFVLDPDPTTHPSCDVGDMFTEEPRHKPAGHKPAETTDSGINDDLKKYLAKTGSGLISGPLPDSGTEQKQEGETQFRASAMAMRVRVPIQLSWCHFLPLMRFILVIRSIDENDIEGVFRVNSLSSFTLGTAQIMGLMFTFANFDGDFSSVNMFVYINIVSQLVNWSITICYFASNVSRTMSNSIIVDSYKANVAEDIAQELLMLHKEVDDGASAASRRGNDGDLVICVRAKQRLRKVEWEIKKMKNLTVKLDCFLPKEVLQIRRVLLQQWADEFALC